jgi:hypothetical protein
MAEFEELKIGVALSDNAAEKIKQFNNEIARFSADNKVARQFRDSADMASRFGRELRGIADGIGLISKLPIFGITGAGGIAGVATAIIKTNQALGEFSRDMIRLRDVSRAAGLLPDQFKNITGQLKRMGYTGEEAEREVVGFFRTLDEAGRVGTAEFQRIWSESFNPETTLAHVRRMRDMVARGEGGRALAHAAEEARAIMQREVAAGRGMMEGRRQAEGWLRSIGLSMRALGITDVADFIGDPNKWQRRIEAAERFNVEYAKISEITADIGAEIQTVLLPAFRDLNEALSKNVFGKLITTSDVQEFRKLIALLEGDWTTFASLLPVGSRLRNAIMGSDAYTSTEVQGPPSPWGDPLFDPNKVTENERRETVEELARRRDERRKQFEENRRRAYEGGQQRNENQTTKEDNETSSELTKELQRINSILLNADAAALATKFKTGKPPGGPAFHNAPQGGAEGESNPMKLPPEVKQPGGGAAAEARIGPVAGQTGRPQYIRSKLAIGEREFEFGSGLPGKYQSAPYGVYPVSEKAFGPKIQKLGGLGLSGSEDKTGENVIYDPQLGRNRTGVAIHPSSSYNLERLYSEGCFAIPRKDWPEAKALMLDKIRREGSQLLEYGPSGARLVARSDFTARDEHNAPQGGSEGESDPMELPEGSVHPGGGAAHEARNDVVSKALSFNLPPMTEAEALPSANFNERFGNLGTRQGPPGYGLGFQGATSQEAAQTYYERLAREGEPVGREPGITDPTGSDLDWAIRLATSGTGTSPLAAARDLYKRWKSYEPGAPPSLVADTSGFVTDPRDQKSRIEEFQQRRGGATGSWPAGGGGGATGSWESDRQQLDRALGADSVDASANLDVSVKGPAGIDVQVNGDGMFKGNTSVNRQVELQ